MAREFAKSFYNSNAWIKCRDAYIHKVGGLCEDCFSKGLYVPGKVVHHLTPITPENINDPSITLSFDNLRFVCQDCHAAEHHPIDSRFSFDECGNIAPPC